MGIQVFDLWSASLIKSMPLSNLADKIIGVDAAYYLESFLVPQVKEPLLSALGGFPLALEQAIIKDIKALQTAGLKLQFVFNGLSHGTNDDPFRPSLESARANAAAFKTYDADMANKAIIEFKKTGSPTAAGLSEFLKKLLHEQDVDFIIAPYSALAQLVYFEEHQNQYVDAIYGPSELFIHGADKIITKFVTTFHHTNEVMEKGHSKKFSRFSLEESSFQWIDRRNCLEDLGRIPLGVFTDACFLAGSTLLPAFPPLKNQSVYPKGATMRDIVSLIISCGNSITQVCAHYSADAAVKGYLDRYKRVATSAKYHIVMTDQGDIEPKDKEHAPHDLNSCIGNRLPEELNMYLSRGMIRPRVLNWLASGQILLTAPYDGGDSPEYQNLVKNQLEPMRTQAISLLADSLHRYYQRKELVTKVWFDTEYESRTNVKDFLPSPKDRISEWNVKGDVISGQRRKLGATAEDLLPGSLSFAVRSLVDYEFASKTITPKPRNQESVGYPSSNGLGMELIGSQLLRTRHEISANAVWRLLQLRGYVDRKHQLTAWGKALGAALSAFGSRKEQEEAAFIAIELLRHNILNADTMFPDSSGAPLRGSEVDKRNCMLVSRVACLGKIHHQPIGYSGPLSQHLLSYYSVISTLQASLRDLVEMSLATMFLEGYVIKDRDDWMDLSLGLPFYDEHSCALGVVVMTYLDELSAREDPTSESTREEMRTKCQTWVEYCDLPASLNDAFELWDAVFMGVKAAGKEIKDEVMWGEVNQWLSLRR